MPKEPDVPPSTSIYCEPPLLVGSLSRSKNWLHQCMSAATMYAYSTYLGCYVMVQIKCKRWGCRHCGERKVKQMAVRCKAAKPTKFITLTVWTEAYRSPQEAYEDTRRKVSNLVVKIRRKWGEFEYLKVLESTKRGWPHYHLVARCGYIPQPWLSKEWEKLAGSKIVDIKRVDKVKDVYFYIVKYLSKQYKTPWTNRRISWSKNFFPEDTKPVGTDLGFTHVTYYDEPPWMVLHELKNETPIARWNEDVVCIDPPRILWDETAPPSPKPITIDSEPPQPPSMRNLLLQLDTLTELPD